MWMFVVASSLASILAGLSCYAFLAYKGLHRDGDRKASHAKLAVAVIQGASLYTLLVCIVGHWILKIPVSQTISAGFGDERFSWLLLGMTTDMTARVMNLFIPD